MRAMAYQGHEAQEDIRSIVKQGQGKACIVIRLLLCFEAGGCVDCCPADLCSLCSASAHGPGWNRVSGLALGLLFCYGDAIAVVPSVGPAFGCNMHKPTGCYVDAAGWNYAAGFWLVPSKLLLGDVAAARFGSCNGWSTTALIMVFLLPSSGCAGP
ncbi:hypothetical protein Nepgr_030617 [Nepenthes gracilis]|uniref:Uncharacterized protein n=1 Tax=Nepenthes gracilis TaxID=150966 RepID=A0AAD3TGL4_NEPGR|nr:hypothetical protein Nepgr_030617 [Nepenthes gracilis]